MAVRVATITIKSNAPKRLAEFWRRLLGYEVVQHPTESVRLDDPEGSGPTLLVQPGEPAASNSPIHLDLRPDDHQQAVADALGLGATRIDVGQAGTESWEVLADPDGNLFCILQSQSDLDRKS